VYSSIIDQFNLEYDESKFSANPVYRDTVTVNTDSFVVVQVAAINPGVWRWHCHVNIHHRGGMAMVLDVGGDSAVEAVRATPQDVNLCPIHFAELDSSSGSSETDSTETDSSETDSSATESTESSATERTDNDSSAAYVFCFTWAVMLGSFLSVFTAWS
jgi:hypothetical protein